MSPTKIAELLTYLVYQVHLSMFFVSFCLDNLNWRQSFLQQYLVKRI